MENVAREKVVRRNLILCVENGCEKCSAYDEFVPNDCSCAILHALKGGLSGIQSAPRRSGKTTKLIELANVMHEAGHMVYYVVPNARMSQHVSNAGLDREIPIVSNMSLRNFVPRISKHWRTVIVCDELEPNEVQRVSDHIGVGHVVGFYTWRSGMQR